MQTAEHAKIPPQPKCFSYGRSIFVCQIRPRPDFSDLCFHWASIVRGFRVTHQIKYLKFVLYNRTIFKYNLVYYWTRNEKTELCALSRQLDLQPDQRLLYHSKWSPLDQIWAQAHTLLHMKICCNSHRS